MRIAFPASGESFKSPAQPLWMGKAHDSFFWEKLISKTLMAQLIQQTLQIGWRCGIVAWVKFPPEYRQKAIRSEARSQQKPIARCGRQCGAQSFHTGHPRTREGRRTPSLRRHDGIAGIKDIDQCAF